jgi:hypothetical protein
LASKIRTVTSIESAGAFITLVLCFAGASYFDSAPNKKAVAQYDTYPWLSHYLVVLGFIMVYAILALGSVGSIPARRRKILGLRFIYLSAYLAVFSTFGSVFAILSHFSINDGCRWGLWLPLIPLLAYGTYTSIRGGHRTVP